MAQVNRRNHFIPRFLLNRFASKADPKKKKHWVWELPSKAAPREISTKDAAVGTHFYGKPETGVETAFSTAEGHFRNVLAALETGTPVESCAEDLRTFVWLQMVRTRGMRQQFASTAGDMVVRTARNVNTPGGRAAVLAEVPNTWRKVLDEKLATLPPYQQAAIRMRLFDPAVQKAIQAEVERHVAATDLTPVANLLASAMLSTAENRMLEAAEQGQIRALSALLGKAKAPDSFMPRHWGIIQHKAPSVILSDICVFARASNEDTGSLLKFMNDWEEIYLPISSRAVIYARREVGQLGMSIDAINRSSAELAISACYASALTDETSALLPLIGTRPRVFTDAEMEQLTKY